MGEIEGVFVPVLEGRWLVERLRSTGSADDVWLAAMLEDAIAYDTHVALHESERTTIIRALTGAVPPRLEQLRAALTP
jgi:hypothetical protein